MGILQGSTGGNVVQGPLEHLYGARTETVQEWYLKRGFSGRFHGGVEVSQDCWKSCDTVPAAVCEEGYIFRLAMRRMGESGKKHQTLSP